MLKNQYLKNFTNIFIQFDSPRSRLKAQNVANGIASNEVVQAYFRHMVDVAVILGANKNRAMKELAEVLDFEIQMNKVSISSEDNILIHTMYYQNNQLLYIIDEGAKLAIDRL